MKCASGSLTLFCAIVWFTNLLDARVADADVPFGAKLRNSTNNVPMESLFESDNMKKKYLYYGGIPPDVTVYLGYAYDPFGPSKRVIYAAKKSRKHNNTTEEFKEESKKVPAKHLNVVDVPDKSSKGDNYPNALPPGVDKKSYRPRKTEPRSKRGVLHLYNMVKCATGCNPISYKGYGCYCGFLGSGSPVDGIDRCCKFHDWCYDSVRCPPFFEYVMPYYWRCYRNRAFCALDHGEFGGPGSCAQRLCECDRILSDCLSKYPCPRNRALCYSSPWRLLQNTLMII